MHTLAGDMFLFIALPIIVAIVVVGGIVVAVLKKSTGKKGLA